MPAAGSEKRLRLQHRLLSDHLRGGLGSSRLLAWTSHVPVWKAEGRFSWSHSKHLSILGSTLGPAISGNTHVVPFWGLIEYRGPFRGPYRLLYGRLLDGIKT